MLYRTCDSAATQRHLFEFDEGVRVPVLIKSVVALLHDEVLLYQRIVEYWPCFENTLERVVCDALRYVMATVSEECGMYRIQKVIRRFPCTRHRNGSGQCLSA